MTASGIKRRLVDMAQILFIVVANITTLGQLFDNSELFLPFPVIRYILSCHALEKMAECAYIFESQDIGDFRTVLQQAFGFCDDSFVNDSEWGWQVVGCKRIAERLRGTVKYFGIVEMDLGS